MAADCVIGVDLGGTKVLAGAVDAEHQVHHRAHRTVLGLEQARLLDAIADAVEEVRAAAPNAPEAAGFGIPSLIDQEHGTAVMSVNLPIADMPFRDVMSERLDLPVFMDNDGNVAAFGRAPLRRGARRPHLADAHRRHGHRRRADPRRRGLPRRHGSGAELGHMVIDEDGPRCQGNCPNRGCLEAVASGTALVREATSWRPTARARRSRGRSPGARADRATGDRARPRRRRGGARDHHAHRHAPRRGDRQLRQHLQPRGRGDRRRRDRRGRTPAAAGPRRDGVRALRPNKDIVRIVPAHFGNEAGMLGAAAMAFDGIDPGAGGVSAVGAGRLVVCPTPIGNLEDVTLRVLSALRDADVVACEDTRRTRVLLDRYGVQAPLVSYHEHNERARAAELVERMRRRRVGGARVRRGHAARVRSGLRARAGLRRPPAWPSRCCRAPRPWSRRWWPRPCPPSTGASPASSRVRRASCDAAGRGHRDARGVRVAGPRGGVAGRARRARSRSPGRRVPGADQGARGGRARQRHGAGGALRRRGAAGRGRARRRWRPRGSRIEDERAAEAVRRLVDAGAKPREAARVVASLTGASANALYRALT